MPSTSKRTLDDDAGTEHDRLDSDDGPSYAQDSTLQKLFKRGLEGVKDLERNNRALRRKIKGLEDKLSRVQSADDVIITPKNGKRSSTAFAQLESQVKQLNGQVRALEKSKDKYRKKIHELRLREAKSEAKDLVEDAEFEVGDTAYEMRKLLRRFHDLMVTNPLEGENEDCPICYDKLRPMQCQSLPCEHVVCNQCAKKLKPVPGPSEVESISCSECRAICSRDDLETVQYTATQQWDSLLALARQWAQMDSRREADTSEEEGEEEFIDDDPDENGESATASKHANPLETSSELEAELELEQPEGGPQTPSRVHRRTIVASPEPDELPGSSQVPITPGPATPQNVEDLSTPPTGESSSHAQQCYAQSPTKDKRKRLEELAEARLKKRRF